jgi:hypothetical protein
LISRRDRREKSLQNKNPKIQVYAMKILLNFLFIDRTFCDRLRLPAMLRNRDLQDPVSVYQNPLLNSY